jgi:hypothetical protein
MATRDAEALRPIEKFQSSTILSQIYESDLDCHAFEPLPPTKLPVQSMSRLHVKFHAHPIDVRGTLKSPHQYLIVQWRRRPAVLNRVYEHMDVIVTGICYDPDNSSGLWHARDCRLFQYYHMASFRVQGLMQ